MNSPGGHCLKVEEEFQDDEGSSGEPISSEGEGVSDSTNHYHMGHRDDVIQIREVAVSQNSAFSLGNSLHIVGITDIYWTFGQNMNR